MDKTINEDLVVSLIKDDIINSKLVNGLLAIGLDASHYQLHLGNTIFQLLGFKDDHYSDTIYKFYRDLIKKIKPINFSTSPEAVDELALAIYNKLLGRVPGL